jgi:hypothetical protein
MRRLAIAFVLTLTACRENTPPPETSHNPPEPIETSNPPALTNAAADWSGQWSSDFGVITFQQQGAQVTASYTYNNGVQGQISGTVTGNQLEFEWHEGPGGAGDGHGLFTMSADGTSFTGSWGKGESRTDGGNWNGKRM